MSDNGRQVRRGQRQRPRLAAEGDAGGYTIVCNTARLTYCTLVYCCGRRASAPRHCIPSEPAGLRLEQTNAAVEQQQDRQARFSSPQPHKPQGNARHPKWWHGAGCSPQWTLPAASLPSKVCAVLHLFAIVFKCFFIDATPCTRAGISGLWSPRLAKDSIMRNGTAPVSGSSQAYNPYSALGEKSEHNYCSSSASHRSLS
jgi:hypothetical protein